MRADWQTKTLEELCSFGNGLWKGKKPPYIHVGIIRNTNFTAAGQLDDTNIAYHDVEEKQFAKRQLQFGDLILEKSGGGPKQPVGRVIPFEKTEGLFSFSNFTSIIRILDPSTLDYKYLHRLLYWYYISGVTEGMQRRSTGIRNLDFKTYKQLKIPLPPLPEQKRIVSILDEAFAAIAIATTNAEKNLANARELFTSALRVCFDQSQALPSLKSVVQNRQPNAMASGPLTGTQTKGRAATDRVIEGQYSLSVGMPASKTRKNWTWSPLSELARLESGHTPSRRHPEYWDGDIPWIGIKDAKRNHGKIIQRTETCTNQLGLDNSAARLLPENTVCLSRTASVGYVTVLGTSMATSQDFVNWVCSPDLLPDYLKYLLLAQNRDFTLFSSGAVHQTIYFPEVKAFHICHPDYTTQCKLVDYLDKLNPKTESLIDFYSNQINRLSELKQSILHKAFTGELTADPSSVDRALSEASV